MGSSMVPRGEQEVPLGARVTEIYVSIVVMSQLPRANSLPDKPRQSKGAVNFNGSEPTLVRQQSSETAVSSKPTKHVETQSSKSITNAALPESDNKIVACFQSSPGTLLRRYSPQCNSESFTTESYLPRNFLIDDAGVLTQQNATLKPKVRLTKVNLTRYHISGEIEARAMSVDQACFIRFSSDNWATFQETEAVNFGNDSCLEKSNNHKYTFDYIIPAPRASNQSSRRTSVLSDSSDGAFSVTSGTDTHGNPLQIQIMPVLRCLGLLYSDDNGGDKYALDLIHHEVNASIDGPQVGEGQELIRKSILKPRPRQAVTVNSRLQTTASTVKQSGVKRIFNKWKGNILK